MTVFFMSTLSSQIITDKTNSFNNMKDKRVLWDRVEQLFHGILNDSVSSGTKSQVFDPRMASLLIERAYRVMSRMGIGKVKGMSNNDLADAKLKNLLLDKYVVPNANSQFDFLTKLRMVDLYSNLYGSFDVLIDQNVKKGYTGPDMWLLNKRDVFLPVGAISLADADKVIVRTWRTIEFFKGLEKDKSFKNISKIIALLENKSGDKGGRDAENSSKREEHQYEKAPNGYFEVLTQYEKDKWTDICVDTDMEFREMDNPHENDELPIERKYSLPLIDDAEGFGDAERGASMQMVQNSMWNLALDGVKLSMYPPILVNKDNIAAMSSIQWGAAKKWLVRGNIQNAIQPINLTPKGIDNFNTFFQSANSSLLNVFGTSDTTVTEAQDTSYGRTPQALKMQQARENTRDNADKFYMEDFITKVMKKMVNLLSKKQSGNISLRMFPDEIQQLARDNPEIESMYDKDKGMLMASKGKKSNVYDYEFISGSTFAQDDSSERENLGTLMQMYNSAQTPQGNTLVNDLEKAGFTLKFGELFKRIVIKSGIQDWDQILEQKTPEEMAKMTLDADAQSFEQMKNQFMSGQSMGQVPTEPAGSQPPVVTNEMPGAVPPNIQ